LDGLVETFWSTFSSVKLALILILAIAAGAFAGALLVQAPPPALESSERFDLWLDQIRSKYGIWTNVFARLQLFNVFTSTWFRLLIVLLAANILVCTTSRTPRLIRVVRRRPVVRVAPRMFERAPLAATIVTNPATPDEAADGVTTALHRRRFRVRRESDGDAVHIFAEKNKYARVFTLVHHLGLIVILLGAIWGGRGGFRESQFIIAEGSERSVGHDTNVSIRLDSFIDEYYAGGGGIPKDYRSNVVVLDGGEEVASGTVRVNEPLLHQGLRIHQAFYGPAIVLQVADDAGNVLWDDSLPLSWTAQERPAGSFVLPTLGLEVFVVGPASAFIDPVIRPGQVRLEIYPQGSSSPLALENISQREPKSIGGLTYTFVRESRFTGLQIVKDPGLPLVWGGSAVVVIGAMVVLMFPHRRLWVRVERDEQERTTVRLAAARERGLPFETEFDHIATALRGRLSNAKATRS
jgi:cytochrome c biogenesis protein